MRRDPIILERQKLYEAVWSKPISHLAPEIGVSTATLIKSCKRMAIPRPAQGYWTRVSLGQKPKVRKLGKLPQGKVEQVRIESWNQHRISRPDVELPQLAGEGTPESPWIERTRRALSRARPAPERRTLTPRGKVLPIVVSEAQVERALSIMAKVLAAADANGWRVAVVKRPDTFRQPYGWQGPCLPYAATISIEGAVLEMSLEEKVSCRWVERRAPRGRSLGILDRGKVQVFTCTGILRFRIHGIEATGGRQSWADTATGKLEDKVDDIALGLAGAAATYRKREDARRRKELEQAREARQIAEEAERQRLEVQRRLEEQSRVDHLVTLADDHATAARIRALVEALRGCERAYEAGFGEWAAWADQVADGLDPATNGNSLVLQSGREL